MQEEPASGDTFEELPQELAQTLTGQIRLSEIAEGVEEQPEEPKKPAPKKEEESFEELIGPLVDEKPNTAEFVRGIEQSINLEKIKSDSKAKTEKTDTDYQAAAQYLSDPNAGAEPEARNKKSPAKALTSSGLQASRRTKPPPMAKRLLPHRPPSCTATNTKAPMMPPWCAMTWNCG